MIEAMPLGGMARALAAHCVWIGREGDLVRLGIDQGHAHLLNSSMQDRLRQALGEYLGAEIRLQIDVGSGTDRETPAQARARSEAERQRAAENAIESDPNVTALQEAFGAQVVPDSVRPVED